MEGGNTDGPADAVDIMALFDDRCHRPADSYAVAAHDQRPLFSIFIGKQSTQWYTVLGSQFENLTDFYAPSPLENTFSAMTWVTGLSLADIYYCIWSKIPSRLNTLQVNINCVAAGNAAFYGHDRRIGDDLAAFQADRAGKSQGSPGYLFDGPFIGQLNFQAAMALASLISFTA